MQPYHAGNPEVQLSPITPQISPKDEAATKQFLQKTLLNSILKDPSYTPLAGTGSVPLQLFKEHAEGLISQHTRGKDNLGLLFLVITLAGIGLMISGAAKEKLGEGLGGAAATVVGGALLYLELRTPKAKDQGEKVIEEIDKHQPENLEKVNKKFNNYRERLADLVKKRDQLKDERETAKEANDGNEINALNKQIEEKQKEINETCDKFVNYAIKTHGLETLNKLRTDIEAIGT